MPAPRYTFFLAHASADKDRARELYDLLVPDVPTFLDVENLEPGDPWDVTLARAQAASRATVALISASPAEPHYRNEEIARAVAYWRRDPERHRLIPVYLDGAPRSPDEAPYGLLNIHGIDAKALGLAGVATALKRIAKELEETPQPPAPSAHLVRETHDPALTAWLDNRMREFSVVRVPGPDRDVRFPATDLVVPLQLQLHRYRFGEPDVERSLQVERQETITGDFRSALETVRERSLCVGLAMIGDPGSGKTTLLQQIFCEAYRHGSEALGLAAGLTPVFVRCKTFERVDRENWSLRALVENQAAADRFPRAASALFEDRRPLLLLLDGLDEVHDEATRVAVCAWLSAEAFERAQHWRFVVTSRIATWRRESRLSEDFLTADVLALDQATIEKYVRSWFRAVKRRERLPRESDEQIEQDALAEAAALLDALDAERRQGDPNLIEMMRNPLSLALLCQVHTRLGELPKRRAELYDACLHVFLERRPKAQQRPSLPTTPARAVLRPLAWWMQSQAADELPKKQIERRVAAPLRGLPDLSHVSPATFVRTAWIECGIFQSRDFESLGFFHAALREYLAASHAVEGRLFRKLAERVDDDRWRNVVALAMSIERGFSGLAQVLLNAGRFAAHAERFTEGLRQAMSIESKPFVRALEAALPDATSSSVTPPDDVLAILRLFEGRKEPKLWAAARRLKAHPLEHVRRAVAQALALAEPRVERAAIRAPLEAPAPGALWREPSTGITFVWIPPGDFRMGWAPVQLTQGFWMAQHPVTNEVYGRFLAAAKHGEPGYWRNARFNTAELPVVGVDYRDALAFCAWATREAGMDDRRFDLPTEAEWEYTARAAGGDGRLREYPWGDEEPTPQRAVFHPSDGTAAVGGRPAGATPLGVHDMAGNVWEWCLDAWQDKLRGGTDPLVAAPPDSAAPRVVRGGSWSYSPGRLRAAGRGRHDPGRRRQDLGFRVVCRRSRQHVGH